MCDSYLGTNLFFISFHLWNFFLFFSAEFIKISGKNSKWKGSRKKGERKAKFPKDPDAPKKPVTAYILYFKDRKQLYVDQNQSCF